MVPESTVTGDQTPGLRPVMIQRHDLEQVAPHLHVERPSEGGPGPATAPPAPQPQVSKPGSWRPAEARSRVRARLVMGVRGQDWEIRGVCKETQTPHSGDGAWEEAITLFFIKASFLGRGVETFRGLMAPGVKGIQIQKELSKRQPPPADGAAGGSRLAAAAR